MKEITVGQDNKTKVIIDKYGYAKIGKTELTADEIQIIATISANERANYKKTDTGRLESIQRFKSGRKVFKRRRI